MTLILDASVEKELRKLQVNYSLSPKQSFSRHKRFKSETSFLDRINRQLTPGSKYFNVKKLKSFTLIRNVSSSKAKMKIEVNKYTDLNPVKANFIGKGNQTMDHLVLGSENVMSKLYSQSIKIQKYLRIKNERGILDQKLQRVNQLIQKENARITSSYY